MEKETKNIEFQINYPVIDNIQKFEGLLHIKNSSFNLIQSQNSIKSSEHLLLSESTSIGPMIYYSEKI
jgi:hypothetical protein